MLGLGLGLSKGANLLSNLKLLTRNSDWAIWGDKANGVSKGINSPAVNPVVDLVGVVGKNLFDLMTPYIALSEATFGYVSNGIRVQSSVISASFKYASLELRGLPPNTEVSLSLKANVTSGGAFMAIRTSADGLIMQSVVNSTTTKFTFTVPANGIVKFRFHSTYGQTVVGDISYTEIQLELGTVATTYEPYGKSNGLLQGFGFTPASGWVDVVAPNGKTVTGLQGDGVNDVVVLPSNAPNPTTGNFAFGLVVKTGANKVKYWLTRNNTSDATTQYAFKQDASGNLFVILEGVAIQIGIALSVGFHSVWLQRDSGTLKAFIDGVETYSGAHSTVLTSRSNTVMMASTTGVGTYTGFSNDIILALKYCDSDIAKNRADWFKFDTKVYGL